MKPKRNNSSKLILHGMIGRFRLYIFTVAFILYAFNLIAGEENIHLRLSWNDPISVGFSLEHKKMALSCQQCSFTEEYLPLWTKMLPLSSNEVVKTVSLINKVDTLFSENESGKNLIIKGVRDRFILDWEIVTVRRERFLSISMIPLRGVENSYRKLLEADVLITKDVSDNRYSFNKVGSTNWTSVSVLSVGNWYKFGVINNAVYKITYNMLKRWGIDPEDLLPSSIGIFGVGGGMLPELNSENTIDDLKEIAIEISGEEDGRFDPEDYILFYAEGAHQRSYDSTTGRYESDVHLYSDTTYYFITTDKGSGKRIGTQTSSNLTATYIMDEFDDFLYYERDETNLIKSGNQWFGDKFTSGTINNYKFNFSNIVTNHNVNVNCRIAARSGTSVSFSISSAGNSESFSCAAVNKSDYEGYYATACKTELNYIPNTDLQTVLVSAINLGSTDEAYLDYIDVNARRNLLYNNEQLIFGDRQSVGLGVISEVQMGNMNTGVRLWEVSDLININEQQYTLSGSIASFVIVTDDYREFIAFEEADTAVYFSSSVENQNLHATSAVDLIIVTHEKFLDQANELADFHKAEGLSVVTATCKEVFNEFSGGTQDLIGIRSFVRMFYERYPSSMPKHLLLFGDGSFDNKHRISGNTNYVPTYQSDESFLVTSSYVSDDYFGLLDSTEGTYSTGDYVDIGIGRLPVKTVDEAEAVVQKIMNYNTAETRKEWRNMVSFIGDDEDFSQHMSNSNQLSLIVDNTYPNYNVERIFFDAYKQESTPGGQRYPDVKKAINERFERGALIVNYTGHGGEIGWAHEKILEISDIYSWQNLDNLPLVVTATCEFSRFDDPTRVSAGEHVLLNPDGGGIALVTTVRLVYSAPNLALNLSIYDYVFEEVSGKPMRLGEIFMRVKRDNSGSNKNTRNFTLLGDPAMALAYPEYQVITDSINLNSSLVGDTIKALQKVTIKGHIEDDNNNVLNDFEGVLFPMVFDKKKNISTLNNDGDGVFNFTTQENKLFRGKVSVEEGYFSFSFYVPKDISYNYGNGKVSYYVVQEDASVDGSGSYESFVIGGSSGELNDDKGPGIDLYLNDTNFVYGGITNENPKIIAKVYDEYGINMVGSGLGHNIIATIDGKTDEAIVLDDYYEADLNSYQKGEINYPLEGLSEGKHKLSLKVWDINNNSSESELEFVVNTEKEFAIDHVYNYPNPFTTRTSFIFEHNHPGEDLDIQIEIFTISGKVVKTINRTVSTEGFILRDLDKLSWDGRDDYGDKLGKGVYLYKMKVRSRRDFSVVERIEKLVIL